MSAASSGTELLDALIDGVHIGDNLVLLGDERAPLDLLVDRFVAHARGSAPLVRVNVATTWRGPVDDALVLDWSPVRTGETSPLPWALPPDASIEQAIAALHRADDEVGGGAAFVFDRLTAVQEAWGDDAPLELFLSACPRLYHQRSLALWPIDRDAHRPTFLRRLTEVTQVVVELDEDGDAVRLTVRKADGRDPAVIGRSVRTEVVDGDLVALGPRTTARERLGTIIRDQRLTRGLSQVDVAHRVGITPSALSQVERGVRGPSGDTLMRLWEVLGVPFGPSDAPADVGYRVARRSGRERTTLQPGLTGERVVDEPTGQQWLLQVAAGASGDAGPFAVKAPETVVVLRGILEVKLGTRAETLHEGDGLVTSDAPVTRWANPGGTDAEVLWTIHPRPGNR